MTTQRPMSSSLTPAGLMRLSRTDLWRVWMLYALIAMCILALPALATHLRGDAPHPTEEETQRGVAARGR